MIPKNIYIIRHQLRKNLSVSDRWHTLHPEYDIQIFDIHIANKKLRTMPDIYYQIFMKIEEPLIQADFLKLVLLYEYGGIVIDCDLEPLCHVETFLDGKVVLCKSLSENKETGYCDKFIASIKQNAFIKQLLYIYINYFLNIDCTIPVTNELSYVIDKISVIPEYVKMIQQVGAHFFYDVCYIYQKKRIMNDRAIYFISTR